MVATGQGGQLRWLKRRFGLESSWPRLRLWEDRLLGMEVCFSRGKRMQRAGRSLNYEDMGGRPEHRHKPRLCRESQVTGKEAQYFPGGSD